MIRREVVRVSATSLKRMTAGTGQRIQSVPDFREQPHLSQFGFLYNQNHPSH